MSEEAINIIFDGPPGPSSISGRFIEVETDSGRSLNVGEWVERPDGLWALRIEQPQPMTDLSQRVQRMTNYETYIQGDRVMFRIGVQSFAIDYDPEDEKEISKEEALEWMRHLLDKALWKLAKGEQE